MTRRVARGTLGALAASVCLWCFAGTASAQTSVSTNTMATQGTTLLFVPALDGEVITGLGIDARLPLSSDTGRFPGTMGLGLLGYRHYFDDEGRFGLGGYATGSASLPLDDVRPGTFYGAGGGLSFQFRAMSPDFIYALFGGYIELGTLWLPDNPTTIDIPTLDPNPANVGTRLVVGIESGFGFLGWLDPYVFGETGVRFGLEYINVGGEELTSVLFSYQLRIDFALR